MKSVLMISCLLAIFGVINCASIKEKVSDSCSNVRIVTRAEWGAQPPTSVTPLKVNPPPWAVIHHTATPECATEAACKSRVLNIQDYHMNTNGWEDIGYNFLVGGDGNIYEGRGWGIWGAHVPAYNSRSIGICFIGTFTSVSPSAQMLEAAQNLIACGVSLGKLTSDYHVIGHRQGGATECPGESLFNIIKTWPHFDSNPSK